MKQDNRGFTLVELIVCIAIFAIVMLAAFGFMTAGSRSFTTVNTRIDRQLKAQLALNHVADTLMNGCTGVSYTSGKLYVLTDNSDGTTGYSVSVYGLSSGSLKYVRKSYSAAPTANTADGVTTLTYSVVGAAVKDLVASGVDTFSVTLSPAAAGKPVSSAVVTLKLKNDTKTYTQTVALRNKPQLISVTS